ncbi:hypothetical protein COW36_11445 [bacterium (Candidatus Blackallbacteria) CG17_big_fil_post_rev_8_21_14_2_50_48_46]|uniref:Right handed beta helix domain-containing protein n=1 Tax=bacterium (Candidatus Blackallbacteria) CG17_big_fil_post_rev_8_21_14_2_50_48_46 TaxID=2014261 RepID=A0A2M7G4R4_9BACT|nr:MAG: hypothetical protein COW64_18540 [bacterium (Candidatus Blackallbacteria) CG18_big_fil_WC_8_21_14_2_50_49_26]PIW16889.1 MAG: hypothetical protein COW36_11445 [bacterium (Candidatus Blackallbacteria) CG17_big_fil_post_rev_8_21_14_2_50_48_46]
MSPKPPQEPETPQSTASTEPKTKVFHASPELIASVNALKISVSSRFLSGIGDSRQITITALDANGQPLDISNLPLEYHSSRPQDFQITPQGQLTALVDFGYSEIQVTLPGTSASASLLFSVTASNLGGSTFSPPLPTPTPTATPLPPPSLDAVAGTAYQIGMNVSVSGTRLDTIKKITVDGVVAPLLAQSPTSIQFQIPAGAVAGALVLQGSENNLQAQLNLSNRVWFVHDTASGNNTGASWADAFTQLQSALALAKPTDEVWLAKGSYRPSNTGDRTAHFMVPAQVRLYGGFAGSETVLASRNIAANESILSGDLNKDDVYGALPFGNPSDNSINILRHGDAALIDGVVIEGGYANTTSDLPSPRGAGLYTGNQSLTLRNTIFRNNYSVDRGGAWYKEGGNQELSLVSFLRVAGTGGGGGGIYNNAGNLNLLHVSFDTCQANGAGGGGIYNNSTAASLSISDSSFNACQANGGGGAGIRSTGGTLTLTRVNFTNNKATGAGGSAIYAPNNSSLQLTDVSASNNSHSLGTFNISSGTLTAVKLNLKDNTATSPGGGIYASSSNLNISQSSFDNNKSTSVGGGIYVTGVNTFTLANTILKNNTATSPGGGLYLSGSTQADITDCTFELNKSQSNGGGMYFTGTQLNLLRTLYQQNQATFPGGGAYINATKLNLSDSRILNNISQNIGGGMYLSAGTFMALDKLMVVGNQATLSGGGLYLAGSGSPVISRSAFANNSSAAEGGGLANNAGNLQLQQVSFSENTGTAGHAIHMGSGNLNLRNSIVWDNEANPINLQTNLLTSLYSVLRDLGSYTLQAGSTGNVATDPAFLAIADPDGADNLYFSADDGLSLTVGSAALNLDSSGTNPLTQDITGRAYSGNPDAGAYELIP